MGGRGDIIDFDWGSKRSNDSHDDNAARPKLYFQARIDSGEWSVAADWRQ